MIHEDLNALRDLTFQAAAAQFFIGDQISNREDG
jgi:hypothetical protein